MTQSDTNPSPPSQFPDQQGKCREFRIFRAISGIHRGENPCGHWAFPDNSLEIRIGNFNRGSGNSNSLILSGSGSSRVDSNVGVFEKFPTRRNMKTGNLFTTNRETAFRFISPDRPNGDGGQTVNIKY